MISRSRTPAQLLFVPVLLGAIPFACGGRIARPTKIAPVAASAATAEAPPALTEFRPATSVRAAEMPPPPFFGSRKVDLRTEHAWKPEPDTITPTGNLAHDVHAWAEASLVDHKSKSVRVLVARSGKQSPGDPISLFPFAARAGKCYRAFLAVKAGSQAVLQLVDAVGAVAYEARPRGSEAFLAVADAGRAACFREDGRVEVIVSIGSGSGDYAVELWGE